MDQRQAQIRERAGLEEGRLNEDFIEFLRTYGVWLLLIAAVVGGGTSAKRWWDTQQANKVDNAFGELESARAAGENSSPDSIAAVADTVGSTRAVGILARLDAADLYLSAVRRGIKAGAKVDGEGKLESADDVLTPEVRTDYLNKAASLYQRVLDETQNNPTQKLAAVGSVFGLAAVAESNRDFDKAKTFYGQIEQMVAGTPFEIQGAVAKERAAKLDGLKSLPTLMPKADLPQIAAPEPAPVAVPPIPTESTPIQLEPVAPPVAVPPVQPPVTPPPKPIPPQQECDLSKTYPGMTGTYTLRWGGK